jgi:hypothetical protein
MIVALTAVIGNFNNEDKMIVVASGIVLKALSSIWDGDKKGSWLQLATTISTVRGTWYQ